MRLTLLFLLLVSSANAQMPDGFIDLTEVIPDVRIELRYYSENNFIGRRITGYNAERIVLTVEAAKALGEAQKALLPFGLSLKIYDGYRPQRAVDQFISWARILDDTLTKSRFYPDVRKQDLFKEGYIASRSGHSRGSTVDLTIVDIDTGRSLDMGSPYDFFGKESWIDHADISAQQKANRLLLQRVMLQNGFRNYPKEWWHFTLRNEPYPETYFDFPID